MVARRSGFVCSIACLVVVGAACFDDAPGDGDVILCVDDDECPASRVCDEAAHVCVAPGATVDVSPPVLNSIQVSPPAAREGIVTITVVAGEEIDSAALLFATDGALAFVPAGVEGTVARFSLDVGAAGDPQAVAEGLYPLRAVRLRDRLGNEAEAPVRAFVEVDRTAPRVSLSVDGDDGGVFFADAAPVLRFSASEAVTVVTASFGDAQLTCTTDGASSGSCTGDIAAPGAVVHGSNVVRLGVVDGAGNAAEASVNVAVDLLAPAPLPGTVEVSINDNPTAVFASIGDRIRIRFVVDEVPASAVVRLRDNPDITFTTTIAGQQVEAVAVVGAVVVDGVFGVEAELADARQQATVALALPVPHVAGIQLVGVVTSPCLPPTRADGDTCADVDGDGVNGPSLGCTGLGLDCDDRDPTTFPGAPRARIDGPDNSCGAGGGATLVYVDSVGGNDFNDGSPGSPFRTLDEALRRGAEGIVLAVGTYLFVQGQFDPPLTADLYGSFDPATWTPAATGRSALGGFGGECTATFRTAGDLVGVDVSAQLVFQGRLLADAALRCADLGTSNRIEGRAMLLDVDASDVIFAVGAADTRVIDSSFRIVEVASDAVHFLRTRVDEGVFVTAGGGVEIVNSVVQSGRFGPVVTCDGCTQVHVLASNFLARPAEFAGTAVFATGPASVRLIGVNALLLPNSTLLSIDAGPTVAVRGSSVDLGAGVLLQRNAVAVDDAALCPATGPFCVQATRADLSVDATGVRVTSDPPQNVVDAYLDEAIDAFSRNYVADIDGACRFVDDVVAPGPAG